MELAQEEYNDVMLDLETLGTRPGDAVISIGAVFFDRETKSTGIGFHAKLDIEQLLSAGAGVTAGTLGFWFGQEDAARKEFFGEDQINVATVLMAFAEFLTAGEGGVNKGVKVWGNGASFDCVLLRETYARFGMEPPWAWWNDRCFRTLKNEEVDKGKGMEPEFDGVKHDAFADARHQAKWLINMYHNTRVFGPVDTDQLDMLDALEQESE